MEHRNRNDIDHTADLLRDEFFAGCTRVSLPAVYCMAGIPGAGKTTFVNTAIQSGRFPSNAFILDPDRVMNALPGYRADRAASGAESAFKKWEMPARTIAYRFFDEARMNKFNIIKDMGCARDENYRKLVDLKSAGYAVHMFYIACDVDEAIRRCAARDRFTPAETVRERSRALLRLLPDYRNLAHSFLQFDNADPAAPYRKAA